MSRLLGPDANGRLVYVPHANGNLRTAAGRTATVYAAASGSTLASIATYDGTETPGSVISGSTLIIDDDSLIPKFWFPDGEDTVYISVDGGDRSAVNADYDARIDAALPLAGGTLTGKAVVNATGADAGYPLGRAGAVETGISILSSFDGGEDSGAGTDTTGRINLYSFQRAQNGSFGENIRRFLMRADAKSMDSWYFPKAGYDDETELPDESLGWTPMAWTGAHAKANDNLTYHWHWSIEAMSQSNGLTTRLEVPLVNEDWEVGDPLYVTRTNIRTHDADFTVSADSGVLRVGGGDGVNKDILISHSSQQNAIGERWKIRGTSDAEAGSNVGTDFTIRRYNDSGSFLGSVFYAQRSTGKVGIGVSGVGTTSRVYLVSSDGASNGYTFEPTVSPGAGAAFDALMTATTDRAHQAAVTGDSSRRWVVFADGKTEWGDGSTRDTNLYRAAADRLKTDDSFHVSLRLGIGQTPDSSAIIAATQTADQPSLFLSNTNASGNTNQAHIRADSVNATSLFFSGRVTGDTVSRFLSRVDGQLQWGDGTNARDVTLYRTAADILKTDDSFVAAARMTVGNGTLQTGTFTAESAGTINAGMFRATAAGTTTLGVLQVESNDNTKRMVDVRVTGDSVSRLKVDFSLGTGSGTLGFGNGTLNDTNLYRSAADTLKTDDSFHVGADLRHLGSNLGFYNATAVAKPTVSGAKGSNAALGSLLTALVNLGLITDSSSA